MMSSQPLRPVTAEERDAFRTHGVVQLKQILPPDWVAYLKAALEDVYQRHIITQENPIDRLAKGIEASGGKVLSDLDRPVSGRFYVKNSPSRLSSELRQFAMESPAKLIAAQLYDANKINFYFDQLFWKEPGSGKRTAFHQDESYFNCHGTQCGTFWISIDHVTRANGAMGYVRGSHLWGRQFAANTFVSQQRMPGSEGEALPDIEGNESDYDIVYFDSEPGDILVHDYRTLHGSTGNTSSDNPRRSFAVRYTGDDVRYLRKPGTSPEAPQSALLSDGDPLDCEDFPVVWRRAQYLAS